MIEFTTKENQTHVQLTLRGALTLREVKEAFDFVSPQWQKNKSLILDLAGVSDIDTMGYQLLLHWKIRARGGATKIHFVNHSTAVLSAIDLFGGIAELGDKVKLSAEDRKRFSFSYGVTRH